MSVVSATSKRGPTPVAAETEEHLKHPLKNGYEKFSENTSMHGFTELYSAKSSAWKIAWLLIIGAAIGITIFQVIQAIDQFVNQTTQTKIENAKPEEVYYPPLKLCLTHWIDWVDAERMRHYGFSKEAVLYGLSFLTTIYSNVSFNTELAVRNFTEGMRINNLTTVSEFYKKISPPIDDIAYMKHSAYYDTDASAEQMIKASELFKETEMIFSDNKNFFCYKANGEDIKLFLHQLKRGGQANSTDDGNEETRNILEFDLNDKLPSKMRLAPEEYNSYIAEWIGTTMPEYGTNEDYFTLFSCVMPYSCVAYDYSTIKPTKILYVDGFSEVGINISPETDKYFVGVRGSAHVWKCTTKNACIPDVKFIVSNSTCPKMCKANATKAFPVSASNKNGDCLSMSDPSVVLGKLDQIGRLCQFKMFVLSKPDPHSEPWISNAIGTTSTEGVQLTTAFNQSDVEEKMEKAVGTVEHQNVMNTTFAKVNSSYAQKRAAEEMRKRCVKTECNSGCEKWSYDISIRTKSMYSTVRAVATKTYTGIQIEYPLDGDILIMREVDDQTWEDFVGNVGGLLGIWTGASILSFIQLVYLCCFAESSAGGELVNAVKKNRERMKSAKLAYQEETPTRF